MDPAVKRAVRCIETARRYCPGYACGWGPTTANQLQALDRIAPMKISIREMGVPTLLLPRLAFHWRLIIDPGVPFSARGYVIRHELGHILAGDADQPLFLSFVWPLPEAEMVADLFALADMLDWARTAYSPQEAGASIRGRLGLPNETWRLRIPRTCDLLIGELVPALGRMDDRQQRAEAR